MITVAPSRLAGDEWLQPLHWQYRAVTPVPFEGLHPAPGVDHAQWVVEAMTARDGIGFVVPDGYDRYARVLHPLEGRQRWRAVAPVYLRAGMETYPYPFPEPVQQVEGDMGAALVDALVPLLAASTTTSQHCHYALWSGWGELHPGSHTVAYAGRPRGLVRARERVQRKSEAALYSFVAACAVQPWWGGRDMLLFDGPLDAVTTIGWRTPMDDRLHRRSPQWWWPADRSWFVATEIDFPWSYVAGSTALIRSLMNDQRLETARVRPSDRW